MTVPRIIYIAGYGRSGSTILDMLLDLHPLFVGAGEVARVFDQWNDDKQCSCLQRLQSCPFWQKVMALFQTQVPDVKLEEAASITVGVESAGSLLRLMTNRIGEPEYAYGRIWRAIMNAIADVSGARVIVDSSKSTRLTSARPLALAKLCGLDVQIIHLVRDPRAVLWSTLRGSNRKLEDGVQHFMFAGGVYRTLSSWVVANMFVDAILLRSKQPVARIRYEDFVLDARRELKNLSNKLGLDLSDIATNLANDTLLQPGHGIAGNRIRRQGMQRLRLDEEWRTHLPQAIRLLALASFPIARRYGYRVQRY